MSMFLRRSVKLIKRELDRRNWEEENLTRNTKNNCVQLWEWAYNRWGIEFIKMDLYINGEAYAREEKEWKRKNDRT